MDQEPEGCVQYLDSVSGTDAAQAYKRQVLNFLALQDGDHVLEVGCGTGDDVRVMAGLVGSKGRVVDVDSSATMIAEARKRGEGLGLPMEYRVSDAHHLDFAELVPRLSSRSHISASLNALRRLLRKCSGCLDPRDELWWSTPIGKLWLSMHQMFP